MTLKREDFSSADISSELVKQEFEAKQVIASRDGVRIWYGIKYTDHSVFFLVEKLGTDEPETPRKFSFLHKAVKYANEIKRK